VTRAFSGRYAGGPRNRFVDGHEAQAPLGYLEINNLTGPLRAASVRAGDPHATNIWASTGFRKAKPATVAAIMKELTSCGPQNDARQAPTRRCARRRRVGRSNAATPARYALVTYRTDRSPASPIGGIMTTAAWTQREPELVGQTVVVIGGSAGIGLETARRARAQGANVILAGRNLDRLNRAASELGAQRSAAFDANDAGLLARFFQDLPTPIDHVMVTAGRPHYGPLLEMNSAQVRQAISERVVLYLEIARNAAGKMRPGGTLLFMGGTGGRRVGHGLGIVSAATAALPAFTAALALELAPIRVNLIAAGFVDTPLSASLLGDRLEERRNELRATLPIGRVVGPADVAALAVHIMSNTALTGATYDIDGGQQFIS
jgi:NAD(P)-dependent dehydrogenase (short-subunit alcohol dehydrogenase family)